jgi:putrescine transport system permease protein
LPIRIYSEVRLGVKPEMNAVCSIMIGVVGLAVIAASLLAKLNVVRGTPARA